MVGSSRWPLLLALLAACCARSEAAEAAEADGVGTCSSAQGEDCGGEADACADDPRCGPWLPGGEASNCTAFGSLLRLRCPRACGTCESQAPFRAACPGGGVEPAVSPGLVRSAADLERLKAAAEAGARRLFQKVTVLSTKPWLLQIDDFLDAREVEEVTAVAESMSFHDGKYYIDTPEGGQRSSSTIFCEGDCEWDPRAVRVSEKTQALLNISAAHFEPIQFVKYGPGHYYRLHSDFVPEDMEAAQGPRLFTVFFYLRAPRRGGETHFPEAHLSVAPVPGRAVVWLNTGGFQGRTRFRWLQDSASQHESKDVLEGEKIGGNLWVHDRDYRTHRKYGCRGGR